jgi:hypothetical protein
MMALSAEYQKKLFIFNDLGDFVSRAKHQGPVAPAKQGECHGQA